MQRRPAAHIPNILSILYLRCRAHPSPAAIMTILTFNSLFEMRGNDGVC